MSTRIGQFNQISRLVIPKIHKLISQVYRTLNRVCALCVNRLQICHLADWPPLVLDIIPSGGYPHERTINLPDKIETTKLVLRPRALICRNIVSNALVNKKKVAVYGRFCFLSLRKRTRVRNGFVNPHKIRSFSFVLATPFISIRTAFEPVCTVELIFFCIII